MLNLLEDNSLHIKLEELLIDHLKGNEVPRDFIWQTLPGTGSTSERSLVLATIGNDLNKYVVKQYRIPHRPIEESRIQAKNEYIALEYLKSHRGVCWRAPYPILFLPEHAVIMMEYFPGKNVNELFWHAVRLGSFSRRKKDWLMTLMQDIAGIIKDMQSWKKELVGLMVTGEAWYSLFLDEQLKELDRLGINPIILDIIRKRFKAVLPVLISEENRCFQHTDLYFNNILYDSSTYCILDLPNACLGTMYWDISHVLVSLDDYKLYRNVDGSVINACKEEFIRNFQLDPYLLETILLLHYCFSFKINLMYHHGFVKKIVCRDPRAFCSERLENMIRRV